METTTLPIVSHSNPDGSGRRTVGEAPCAIGSLADIVQGNLLARRVVKPSYLELILTHDCNLRCSYCWEINKQAVNMSKEVAAAAINFLLRASGSLKNLTVLFFGGEPMLCFDLLEWVCTFGEEKAAEVAKAISWDMTTNGTLIDEEKARWLAEHKIKYILSMDGGKEDHDRYRRFPNGNGSFELLKGKIRTLKSYQPWMGARLSVMPETARNLRKNVEELWALGINQFIIGYAHGVPWTLNDLANYEAGLQDVGELYLEMKFHRRHFRITMFEEDSLCECGNRDSFGCGAGRARICADPKGDLFGCSKFANIAGTADGILPLGNVFQGFTRSNNRMLLLREDAGPRKLCADCELRPVCSGGCPAVSFAYTGDVFIPDMCSCQIAFVQERVRSYMRRRHDEVFGTQYSDSDAAR